jgi:hypothetical protein
MNRMNNGLDVSNIRRQKEQQIEINLSRYDRCWTVGTSVLCWLITLVNVLCFYEMRWLEKERWHCGRISCQIEVGLCFHWEPIETNRN